MHTQQSYPLTDRRSNEIIVHSAEGPVSVAQFLAAVTQLSATLPPKQYVVNLHVDRYAYQQAFFAAVVAGQCTLLPPNRQPGTIAQLMETYADCYTLDADIGPVSARPDDGSAVAVPGIPADQLCAIAFTSGSTGSPQPATKYWQTLRDGSLSNRQLLLGDRQERLNIVSTVPAQHMWGLETSVLLPMFANVAVFHQVPFFPKDIATALEQVPAPRVLVSSPIHLETLLKSGVATPPGLKILTATAPLSQELANDLESRLGAEVLDVFGCSESGIIARRRASRDADWRLADRFRLRERDDGVEICAEHLPETVMMPDRVELIGDDGFRWIGRQEDLVNIAGKRGSFADLNQRLRRIEGVEDGVIFQPPDNPRRLAALVVAPTLKSSDILAALKGQVEPVFLPRPILQVPDIPRQETGKLSQKTVHELFAAARKAHA